MLSAHSQSHESSPFEQTPKMLLVKVLCVLAGVLAACGHPAVESAAENQLLDESTKAHKPYWPTFSSALHLDSQPEAEGKKPDPELLKVVPHQTHHQHDTEFWEHYLETHEAKDNSHAHEDELHFQDNAFGYETEHHCIYDLRLNYIWGSPDGVWKRMIAYNGQFPGPTIYCTAGKKLIVRVTNDIEDDSEPTSIHWHGIQQTLTPFYDGPQALSQCPLLHNKTMIYKFPVFQAGTYWYHSHHSYQYIDGNWGFLVIKNSPGEVWGNSYDDERLIAVNDWYHRTARDLVETYVEKGLDGGGWPSVNSSLINGRGSFNCSLKDPDEICNPKLQGPAVVSVKQGKRYRFRILNSSAQNAYNFSIDAHKMQVIETDGVDTQKSTKFDVLYIIPGQRYSVIVIMDQPPGEYWMRSVSDPPEIAGPPGSAILSVAPNENGFKDLLKRGAEPKDPDFTVGQGRAHYHDVPWEDIINAGGIPIPQSNQFEKYFPKKLIDIDLQLQQKMDAKHLKQLQAIKLPTTTPVDPSTALLVDDLSDTPPLLFGPDGGRAPLNFSREVTFDVTDCPTEENKARLCINDWSWTPLSLSSVPILHQAIQGRKIAPDQIPVYTPVYQEAVRIVVNNHHPFSHPWHLHGHTFWLLGAGAEGAGRFNATRDEALLRSDGVRRDTVRTKGNSWAVLVYYTDNPGVWFFHCHIAWHLEVGLGATFIEAGDIARRIYHVAPFEAKKTCNENGVKI